MPHTRHPGAAHASASLTRERIGELLDAYGGAPERWPEAERAAAQRLVDESAAARALWQEARELDRLLDSAPEEPPSPTLATRVLAAAPRRRRARLGRPALVAAIPLAAAAALVLWLAIDREPAQRTADLALVQVGEYTSPTDVLLDSFGVDVFAVAPSVGCSDSALGCPEVDSVNEPYSQPRGLGRSLA